MKSCKSKFWGLISEAGRVWENAASPHQSVARRSNAKCPDNHIEGSSSERYRWVVDAMRQPTTEPDEETEMPLYGGIDLHANNSVIVLLNEQDEVIYQKRLPNNLTMIIGQLDPYRTELQGADSIGFSGKITRY